MARYQALLNLGTISLRTVRSECAGPGTANRTLGQEADMAIQPKGVIVVDDDPGFLKSVARLLSVHGFEPRTFSSAEALLDSDAAVTANPMLLDIHLGGISGIELQRRLVASGSKCPVIFMTSIDDDATRKEAMNAGCVAYLKKPFAPNLLLDALGKAVP
jgi:FixJ family two-component response regulator